MAVAMARIEENTVNIRAVLFRNCSMEDERAIIELHLRIVQTMPTKKEKICSFAMRRPQTLLEISACGCRHHLEIEGGGCFPPSPIILHDVAFWVDRDISLVAHIRIMLLSIPVLILRFDPQRRGRQRGHDQYIVHFTSGKEGTWTVAP